MDAVFVSKMSVGTKWHVTQILEQCFVCTHCEAVENQSARFIFFSRAW
jgi:hypothetical protein